MKFLVSCLLALLVPCSVMAGLVIPVSPSKFTDPYSNNDALLDMFLPTSCANGLTVRVNLPSVDGGPEANARFQGPAFSKTVNGISIATGSSVAVSALLTWDPVANTLTFQDFSTSSWAPWNNNPGYINVNFDIPSAEFQNPGAPDYLTYPGTGYATYTDTDPTHVPLAIVGLNPPESAPLFIDLRNVATDFTVGQSSDVRCGPSGPHGDPVFSGFQGQEFQFHGLPDEHFNVVSSPDLQLNSHFVYLSAGKCDYNDTECWTHPGTYMDVLGFQIAEAHIKIVAGTHDQGLRVWFNDVELPRGAYIKQVSTNITTASLKYHKNGKVQIITDIMGFEVVNSDMFMNIRTVLNNQRLLHIGATTHTVTDAQICKTNGETHNYQLVEATVAAKYPVTTPLHGLMGQTWRNVKVCGRDWMGTVADYLVSDLFANDNHYNYFKW